MEKVYNPQDIEQNWYNFWISENYFAPSGEGPAFSLMLPPPNVTGSLHMGHGFGYTIMDILVRYHRMKGDNTLWQSGSDHAGIATQMVVERKLAMENQNRQTLGREAFVEKVWEWKEESGGNITKQLQRLGASLDHQRERFTMDESYSHAVREEFIRLYEEGLIYRGTRLVNWDPKLLTAISDLEVISNEEEGKLWHIRYPLVDDPKKYLTVATTRPETLLGDVAVAVNPEDERYRDLVGKMLRLPLTDRTIPIIEDTYVEKDFGSGCVKITPAHDFNDYQVGQRHALTPINIFTPNAHINENAPKKYQGLERFKARAMILEDLEAAGLLAKTEKHISKIPRGEKTDVVVEPYLTEQWYLSMKPLVGPAIDAVKNGDIKFIPETWSKTYFQWLDNIEDWCISRQLWWGHRIPVWYDEGGKVYVGQDEQDVRTKNDLGAEVVLRQEEDVLDTWFSSALWPFATLGWPEDTKDLKTFYPTSVLVTGFDIIFFWVARMIMMGLKFTGQVPFKEVYFTGLIRDAEGKKMSKSKGNVLDPLDLIDGISLEALIKKRTYGLMQSSTVSKIEKDTRKNFPEGIAAYGTDALRFTFCALASYGREIRFDIGRLEGYRNFCNKIWNATRYVLMNTEDKMISSNSTPSSLPDRWILSRLQNTIEQAKDAIQAYRFDLLASALYDFTWNEFCDWYLELSKPILNSPEASPEELQGTRYTLVRVLESLLRLLHPIMPFITEEIWQKVSPLIGIKGKSIMLQPYPTVEKKWQDAACEKEIEWIKLVITQVRTLRSEMNIPPGKPLPILFNKGSTEDRARYERNQHLINALAKFSSVTWLDDNAVIPESATALVGDLEILVPMAGIINKEEEIARLNKEIIKLSKETDRIESKLQNNSFVERAPSEVVVKEKEKLAELTNALEKLKLQKEKIAVL